MPPEELVCHVPIPSRTVSGARSLLTAVLTAP